MVVVGAFNTNHELPRSRSKPSRRFQDLLQHGVFACRSIGVCGLGLLEGLEF